MSRTGKITVYSGTGKVSGKPFKALKLEITPTLSKLYFLESRFEMDHAIGYLEGSDDISTDQPSANQIEDDKIDLSQEDDLPKEDEGLFTK